MDDNDALTEEIHKIRDETELSNKKFIREI
jgi:hypothetical protein